MPNRDEDQRLSELYGHPLTAEHYKAIGIVAMESALANILIESAIWALLGTDQKRGQYVTHRQTFARRLDLLGQLVKQMFGAPDLLEELTGLIEQIDTARRERNRVIHDHCVSGQNEGVAGFVTIRPGRPSQLREYSPSQIEDIALRYQGAVSRFILLLEEHGIEIDLVLTWDED